MTVLPVNRRTHPVSCADSLIVDPIALMRQQRSVPVTVVGPVVTCTSTQVNKLTNHAVEHTD